MSKDELTFEDKLLLTKMRIQQWVEYWGIDHIVVSFSGGKDSTVLLDIAREMYPEIKAVFSDTGMEYPEIRDFVKTYGDSVAWVKPERTFRDVLFTEGYPIVSKKVSEQIRRLRMGTTDKNKVSHNLIRTGFTKDGRYLASRKLPIKWKFLENLDFKISEKCCDVFKKKPLNKYNKENDLRPMTGMMVSEGGQRAQAYTKCNMYAAKSPISNPLLKWGNEDIWQYINDNNLAICDIYRNRYKNGKKVEGERRTGCMFCMYGVHLEKGKNRFQKMKESHPKMYNYCINKLGMGGVLDAIKVDY